MPELVSLAKIFIFIGISITVIGILIFFSDKVPFLWRLPGDIDIQRKNFSFFFPIASCLLISIILSVIIYLISRKW